MDHISATPFGRRQVDLRLINRNPKNDTNENTQPVCKWTIFRALCQGKEAFSISDRDLTVLNALISCHPEQHLENTHMLIVFPSNETLSTRAHGMAESTLRRHIANLVKAGLILRHDSPNGKRYVARNETGEITRAFGFDISPLIALKDKILEKAQEIEERRKEMKALREEIVLTLRDLEALRDEHHFDDQEIILTARKSLRRKLTLEALNALKTTVLTLRNECFEALTTVNSTEEKSGNDSQNERHIEESKPDLYNIGALERNEEPKAKGRRFNFIKRDNEFEMKDEMRSSSSHSECETNISLGQVITLCPDILPYAQNGIRNWYDLVSVSNLLHRMLGISQHLWREAQMIMGAERAAITLAYVLQRSDEIKNPGGYLRRLCAEAREGRYSISRLFETLMATEGGISHAL